MCDSCDGGFFRRWRLRYGFQKKNESDVSVVIVDERLRLNVKGRGEERTETGEMGGRKGRRAEGGKGAELWLAVTGASDGGRCDQTLLRGRDERRK